jgi:protocatechuate 3,4-dioxygenase beta subunit
MRTSLFVMMLIGLILLGGCSQADEPQTTPTTIAVVQQPTTGAEPTLGSPTQTAQPESVGTIGDPTSTSLPEPTEMPVVETAIDEETGTATAAAFTPPPSPTVTPLPEPTTISVTEPSATAIPCSGVLTSPNQEGPFYSPGSPERTSLIDDGMPGVPILIFGRVFDQDCNPIAGAKLDFWLADVNGEYDNVGYVLRGHLFADQDGNYALESIEPTPYTGRPPHIHAKVFAPDSRELLTTQMYFSGSEGASDVISAPDLLANYVGADENGQQQLLFNFIVHLPIPD